MSDVEPKLESGTRDFIAVGSDKAGKDLCAHTMTESLSIVEGYANYDVPSAGKPCKTWYKVFGDLSAGRRPLVALHGGPGCIHKYLLVLSQLTEKQSIPLVLYDQLGNGNSTHLPEKMGDTSFWTMQLFLDELNNLLSHLGIQDDYDLLGHSFGGMLASEHAVTQPKGLKRLIIASSPASMGLWVEAADKLRADLSQEVQDALKKHEKNGTTDSKEYLDAVDVFYARHLCVLKPMPAELLETLQVIDKDPTVYHTMNGPNEFYITGSLKEWSIISRLHKINVSTLLTNGNFDEAQDSTVQPFFDKIARVKWVHFEKSSHTPHLEETERYIKVIAQFLELDA